MPDRGIKTFDDEAQDYYVRGMGAARGGQRTMATRLLRQAVRLNPYHDQAWVGLSEVLDDRDDIMFCLRTALQINPTNDRARQALQRFEHADDEPAGPRLEGAQGGTTYRHTEPTAWWEHWRDARVALRTLRRTLWMVPLLLIAVTLALRTVLVLQPLPEFATPRDFEAPAPTPDALDAFLALEATVTPPVVPFAEKERQQLILNRYWDDIAATRATLQTATTTYRQQTEQSRTTVDRAAAARVLREELDRAQTALYRLLPPPGTREAHIKYVAGLSEERQAIDDLLTFYSDNNVMYANRAGVRMQSARINIAEALAAWTLYAQQTDTDFGTAAGQSE